MRFAYPLASCRQGGAALGHLCGKADAFWVTHSSIIIRSMTSLPFPVLNTYVAIHMPWLHLDEAR